MSKTNILVVEDESIVSKDIQHSLNKLGYFIVGAASTGERALELVRTKLPDLVLMDIMLKGDMNGIEVAEIIKRELAIPVVFLTAYADESTLTKAKLSEPYGYIIKPFKEIDLHTSIEMAVYKHRKEQEIVKERNLLYSIVENMDASSDFIFVKSNTKLFKLVLTDIYYIEEIENNIVIHTLDLHYTIPTTLSEIEKKIGSNDFVKVHDNFIVRIDKIQVIEDLTIVLDKNKRTIDLDKIYLDELNMKLKFIS
jgi:two-component system response regulator LytT